VVDIPLSRLTNSPQQINFLHLLEPASSPQYSIFVQRIIAHSDQQASIFLQQKLKASGNIPQERMKIVDAICSKGFEMMASDSTTPSSFQMNLLRI
jgi:pumilio RNA-binding family